MKIEFLFELPGLSTRAQSGVMHLLKRKLIQSITLLDLLKLRNCGKKTAAEIIQAIECESWGESERLKREFRKFYRETVEDVLRKPESPIKSLPPKSMPEMQQGTASE